MVLATGRTSVDTAGAFASGHTLLVLATGHTLLVLAIGRTSVDTAGACYWSHIC